MPTRTAFVPEAFSVPGRAYHSGRTRAEPGYEGSRVGRLLPRHSSSPSRPRAMISPRENTRQFY